MHDVFATAVILDEVHGLDGRIVGLQYVPDIHVIVPFLGHISKGRER